MDREFILQAVKTNGSALEYADESLKKDREFILQVVKTKGYLLKYAHESFKKDREIVLQAVKTNGAALEYADESFKKDRKIVLQAIKTNDSALLYADESLKKDRKFILQVVKQLGNALYDAEESPTKDRDFILIAGTTYGNVLLCADESLKKDREFILQAVKTNGFLLLYADESFKKDREIVLQAVKTNSGALEHADESLKKDRDFILQVVKLFGNTLLYAGESLKEDREIVLQNYIVSLGEIRQDFEFVYLVSKINKNTAKKINESLFSTIDTRLINQRLSKNIIELFNNNFSEENDLFYCLELNNKQPQTRKMPLFNFLNKNYSTHFVEKLVILEILKKISSINPSCSPSAIEDIDYHIFCCQIDKYLTENQPKETLFSSLKKVVEDLSSKFEIAKYSEKEVSSILHFYEEWTRDRNQFDNYREILTQYKRLGGNTAKIFEVFERFRSYSKIHFNNRFQVISVLGFGGEGVVFKVFNTKLNQYVAFKIKFDKLDGMDEKTTQERVKFLKRDDIEGKIKCYDCNVIDGYMYSIMELGEETVQDFIDRNTEFYQKKPISKDLLIDILTIFNKLLYSVKTLEDHNILHRDLDPKNIVKVGDQYKIIDFDIAKVAKAGNTITLTVGKYYYMSPEVSHESYEEQDLKDERLLNNGKITTACDIFSLGCILLKLLTNCVLKLDESFLEDSNIQKYDDHYLYFDGYGIYFYQVLTDLMREKKLHHAIQKTIDRYIDPSLGVNTILIKCLITMIQKDPSKRLKCYTHLDILSKLVKYLNGSNGITIESIEKEMENYMEITPLKDVPEILKENTNLREDKKRMAKELEEANNRIKELEVENLRMEEEIRKLKSLK